MQTILFPEDSGVKKVKELYGQIKDAIDSDDEVVMDFKNVNRLDLAVMQVVMAAHRKCRKEKRLLKIRGASDVIKKQMHVCGLLK